MTPFACVPARSALAQEVHFIAWKCADLALSSLWVGRHADRHELLASPWIYFQQLGSCCCREEMKQNFSRSTFRIDFFLFSCASVFFFVPVYRSCIAIEGLILRLSQRTNSRCLRGIKASR